MNKLIKYIELEEFKKILKAEKDRKFKLAYSLAFGSGLRISEIIGLPSWVTPCCKAGVEEIQIEREHDGKKLKRWGCLDCSELYRKVNLRFGKGYEYQPLDREHINLQRHTIRIIGKGGKERITMTSPWLKESHLKLLPLKIERRTLQSRFKRLAKKVLGKNMSIHTLRHGWANHLVNEKGVPMTQVQVLGGWARLDTLGIYAKANPIRAVEKAWESF